MLKNKGRSKRELLTTNGKVEFSRTLLVPANQDSINNLAKIQKEKSVCPLDIMLGINSNVDTCWFNEKKETSDLKIKYIVNNYDELLKILI